MGKYLYETMESIDESGLLKEIPLIIENSLSEKIVLREYQKKAFRYFVSYVENENLLKNKQIHNLFHMATGSGKTVIMAGLIMYLYTKGYRNFLFFVNQTNILEKTKENFSNKLSSKYLFKDELNYLGNNVNIKVVDNFSTSSLDDDIQICFTTTQKLHMDLFLSKENSLTYNDFEDQKVVFISDESHHINSMTKAQKKTQELNITSWENSVMNAFYSNKENILLEFTATADIKDNNVALKYKDKMIFNYPLKNFRESGYTKDFKNFATDTDLWDRALIALIISEYRKYLFADNRLNIKPVIMMKSQKIAESEAFYNEFFRRLSALSHVEIQSLDSVGVDILSKALNYFKNSEERFDVLVESLKTSFAKDYSIIINSKDDDTKEKQLLVNSLEDESNPIRIIFSVDMLNEGWDVLNLFDIVRLYDTRQASGKAGKIGAYTISEAQLIGRGARYCPFQIAEEENRFTRKYDNDIHNKHRILETMLFHSKNDSKYITELKQALIATGLQEKDPIHIDYILKQEFKDSEFYKKALVFSNKRIPKGRSDVKSLEGSLKNSVYRYQSLSNKGKLVSLFGNDDDNSKSSKTEIKTIAFKDIDYNILLGASEKFNELKFSVLKEKYPGLKSTREFLTSDDYCGNSILEINYVGHLTGRDLFKASVKAFTKLANHITSIKQEFIGSKEFSPRKLKTVLKDKTIYLSQIDSNGGKGASQVNCPKDEYKLDLSCEPWYVFTDNYGTSEEKLFVKYFKTDIESKLKAKKLEYYVVRNERIPDLAIYSFDDGERFEPDFLLFVRKENIEKTFTNYQLYAEPKGNHLLQEDSWKEEFLTGMVQEAKTEYRTTADEYKIIGLPFFNENNKRVEFTKAIEEFIRGL